MAKKRRNPSTRRVTALPKLPRRQRSAHKGAFGRVLVIGGSRGMIGAPALVANAALRSGAGLVTVACPKSIQLTVAGLCPCATTIPLPENASGMIDPRKSALRLESLGLLDAEGLPTVVAAGPGLGTGNTTFNNAWGRLVAAFSQRTGVPVVLDADALNALAASRKRQGTRVDMGLGNAGMATGGSGDVLTGVIAALIGQGLSRFDASVLGVHVHGRAGDIAARALGQVSLVATDLIGALPQAFSRRR